MFLSDDDLTALTGYRRPTAQAEWLKARGIRHYVNGAGRVVIKESWLDDGERRRAKVEPMPRRPNLAVIGGKE